MLPEPQLKSTGFALGRQWENLTTDVKSRDELEMEKDSTNQKKKKKRRRKEASHSKRPPNQLLRKIARDFPVGPVAKTPGS